MVCGSSPLTRGKHYARRARDPPPRLIPAHAGKTVVAGLRYVGRAAHPRSRGENSRVHLTAWDASGSSPLTRGKRSRRPWPRCIRRLIPAHAGKTWRPSERAVRTAAHPRSRGENAPRVGDGLSEGGSSPLTRGKRRAGARMGVLGGLIPAHAGKTVNEIKAGKKISAHPRSRGENRVDHGAKSISDGSSPLTRGKLEGGLAVLCGQRLIPAHAGKTYTQPERKHEDAAHPRSRGENPGASWVTFAPAGSSPLTRGKLCGLQIGHVPPRLIPAHAGKTPLRPGAVCLSAAHPRSRGENHRVENNHTARHGSSPLTRGKRSTMW